MSGAPSGSNPTQQATVSDTKDTTKPLQPQQKAAQLEEDDEFEDFPVEDWAKEDEVGAQQGGSATGTQHLWEESWDDDDTTDDFSVQLKEELKKMEGQRK